MTNDGAPSKGGVFVSRGDTGADDSQTTIDNSAESTSTVDDHSVRSTTSTDQSSHRTHISADDNRTVKRTRWSINISGHVISGFILFGIVAMVIVAVVVVAVVALDHARTGNINNGGGGRGDGPPPAGPGMPSGAAPEGMVGVPAGDVTPDGGAAALHVGTGFWMDATEVTNESFRRFLLVAPDWQKDRLPGTAHDGDYLKDWTGTRPPAGRESHPVVYVTWPAADAYCRWLGRRLPTAAEWEYAARAGAATPYWWGAWFDPSRANAESVGTQTVDNAAHRNGFGLFDMAGNVWEWTATEVSGTERIARGGGWRVFEWQEQSRLLRADAQRTLPQVVTAPDLGFRCAASGGAQR